MRFALLGLLLSGLASADTYVVGPRPHGSVKFKVEGPFDDVIGETSAVGGELQLDSANWGASKGVVTVDLSTISTGIDQRDRDMQVEFLQVSRFPFAVLEVLKIDSATKLEAGKTADGQAVGTFEVHGVRRAVLFPIKATMDASKKLTVSGSFPVPFADYGIQRPSRLFLKLGEVADVSFNVTFVPRAVAREEKPAAGAPTPPKAPTVAVVQPASAKPKPRPARKPKPELPVTFLFKGNDDKAKGERLFHSPKLGEEGSRLTCGHCHLKSDERNGFTAQDGYARAANSMRNAAQRPSFWNGFAKNVGEASDICQKLYMRGTGLSDEQKRLLTAFVSAISPDPAPELDYKVLYRTYDSALSDPTGGDPVRGKALADKYCMTCHLDGRVGPTWAPGLYEPDWVVRRVRRLEGHSSRQMPPFSIQRLPDSELRDIVTYLTSPKVAPPVFNRKLAAKTP